MFHKTILSEVHRWVQSARRCQQVGLTKPLQGEYSQYHSVYKCVPALFLCFFCCESFSWSIMSTDSAAGSGRNEHVPVTSFFPSLLPPFAANFSRRFSSMACANHTILLASSIFNPLIDVSFWKCRCRFAFPMGQSLCCLFNDYIYICRANPQTKGVHAASSVETGWSSGLFFCCWSNRITTWLTH